MRNQYSVLQNPDFLLNLDFSKFKIENVKVMIEQMKCKRRKR